MAYFGGSGVSGDLHPSLQTYIDCFLSSPMPKMYPRGGGPHDQDPILMRDFREIRKIEIQSKELKEQMEQAKNGNQGGGLSGLGGALEEYMNELGEEF